MVLESDTLYRQLGVRWWGEGTFIREENRGKEIKAKSLFRMTSGWIVYNRLFAFRGSFAVVADEHEGAFASNEFPTFKVRDGVEEPDAVASYVVHLMNSPQYMNKVDAQSTGSTQTSRNRFQPSLFLKMQVAIPASTDRIKEIVRVVELSRSLGREQQELAKQLKIFRESIARRLPG